MAYKSLEEAIEGTVCCCPEDVIEAVRDYVNANYISKADIIAAALDADDDDWEKANNLRAALLGTTEEAKDQ